MGVVVAVGFTVGYGITLLIDGFHWLRLTAVIAGAGASTSLIEKWIPTVRFPGSPVTQGQRAKLSALGDISPASLSGETLKAVLRIAGITAWTEESGLLRAQLDGYSIYVNPTVERAIALSTVFGVTPDATAESLTDIADRWNAGDTTVIASAHPEERAFRVDEELEITGGISPLNFVRRIHEFRSLLNEVTESDVQNVLT
jgi:hypothetical protein